MNENRCIACGELIPEGRMICPTCESKALDEKDTKVVLEETFEDGRSQDT